MFGSYSVSSFSRWRWLAAITVVLIAVAAWAAYDRLRPAPPPAASASNAHEGHDHAHGEHAEDEHAHDETHDHAAGDHGSHDDHGDHPGHEAENALELSVQARKNIGLKLETIALRPFVRTTSIPGMVVERPGRSQIAIPSPMTGIVTKIYAIEGETVLPGQKLFEMRLAQEELVAAQTAFLAAAEQRDVVLREVERLVEVSAGGVIAGKTLLARQYELQKLEAELHAKRQGLLLHDLTDEQVDQILATRLLLKEMTVTAPPLPAEQAESLYHVQHLDVQPGQHIVHGEPLMMLANHAELFIEGKAFEADAQQLNRAAKEGWEVNVEWASSSGEPQIVPGLQILYIADRVEQESRALHFYLRLPNETVRDATTPDGSRFVAWRFKPGQRVNILLPVERWEDRIVLPVDAVIDEGAESFVFTHYGDHFDRVPVHVEYRDPRWAVISPEGRLGPGDTVATLGAYQMHLAIKNRSGAGADPHAGHSH